MSIGGIVIEVIRIPGQSFMWCNTKEYIKGTTPPVLRGEECAVWVAAGYDVLPGDKLWWRGQRCCWTDLKRGIIEEWIPRRGYSGGQRPTMTGREIILT